MGRKSRFSKELKIEVCKKFFKSQGSTLSLAFDIGANQSTVAEWINIYKIHGSKVFDEKPHNKNYSLDFKLKLIKECENSSVKETSFKYALARTVVRSWIKKYNEGTLESYDPKPEVYSMKSRKTSFEERLQIVKWVIDNDMNYKGAAAKFTLPYHQVFNWTKKYLELGEEGIKENRGRPSSNGKSNKELTEIEKKDLEIKKLKMDLERQTRAVEILKKNLKIREEMMKDSRKYDR